MQHQESASQKQLHKHQSSTTSNQQTASLWQHPYVDVFKHFKVMPQGEWRQNKKQGDVEEIFAKEIGRKAMNIVGSISANNFIQIPHPTSLQKSLGLNGRYLYLMLKSQSAAPFSLHFDFGMAERGNNVRVSISNLFKAFNHSSGFVIQVPLELHSDRWTVVCIDLSDLMQRSHMFPSNYNLEGAHSMKGITLCANVQVRGVYTSDNEYDFVTLPSDMRFKFPFDNHAQITTKWLEYFDWNSFPSDWDRVHTHNVRATQPSGPGEVSHLRNKGAQREDERARMSNEIDGLLNRKHANQDSEEDLLANHGSKRSRIGKLPEYDDEKLGNENLNNFNMIEEKRELNKKQTVQLGGLQQSKDYVSGQYCGLNNEFKRSAKISQDPIIELRHIIGYSPDRCLNLRWSRFPNDPNVVIFTSGGTLIAMDIEHNQQKRFFFGHSAPICCFDVNANGALIASAQEGKNSIIRVWEYMSGRCISMMTMPVNQLKCLAFSYDGKYLASVGKDSHNKEMIVVWDITRIGAPSGGKPEIVAKQTSDFNILNLRFSPIDSSRMASCGKENIRFWRIKDNGSIRGSAVVLNHHARNTVFTCLDFEYGLRSVDPKENESLKRLFVGSKHGMVFQVNYHTESLEATYQTNDSAIFGISVNEAFCVTGSEDTYLRVWPLDFSEFFMEAKHEGTVGAVEISPDGLKVVCGTLNGSLGVLDKSNQRYRTFLRSHTDQIVHMDYHLGKRIIITVSKDKTIRLWDIATSDQVYEFSSPVDQALCVAAHPTLPLFSCGFESGVMRVFDIERTCVADEFCQFNKPLAKLQYAPQGDLLVSCCIDGGVAIHNPRRQHLPIKMLHLEFPPEFVHVAFTQLLSQSGVTKDPSLIPANLPSHDFVSDYSADPLISASQHAAAALDQASQGSRFAVMGDYGNNINIYDSRTFIVSHQIHAQQQLKQFIFSNNNRELVVMTSDCRVRFYSLARYEGLLLREVSAVHRGSITSLSVSQNSGYFLTGGEDSILKVWDYEATKTLPQYFQAFIGHTYPVRAVMFCPSDNSTIMSVGDKDGIFLWSFYGDVRTQFAHQTEEITQQDAIELKKSKSGSVLEKLRNTKKDHKIMAQYANAQIKDGTFIIPTFKSVQPVVPDQQNEDQGEETSCAQQVSIQHNQARKERGLTYNHYSNITQHYEVDLQPHHMLLGEDGQVSEDNSITKPSVINGYDGFGGVHDNLVWCQVDGWMAYTLHNKVIFENVKTREQTVMCDSASSLSTLALSLDKKLLAVGEGRPSNKSGNSMIYLYDTEQRKLIQRYTFHQRGVQALAFSNTGSHLISVGVQGENNLAIWDLSSGLVVRSCLVKNTNAVNTVVVDPYVGHDINNLHHIQFSIAGNQGLFNIYRYEIQTQLLQAFEVDNVPPEFQTSDFTSISYTQFLNGTGTYFAMLGASDGSMTAYDLNLNVFVDGGMKKWMISGEIGHARCNNGQMVVASSSGTIARFAIQLGALFPVERSQLQFLRADGAVVSLAMDDLNNEGLLGTVHGTMYYLNFNDKLIIRIVNKAYSIPKAVTSVRFCDQQPVILSNCSCSDGGVNGSGVAKVWTVETLDQVMKFSSAVDQAGPVAIVLPSVNNGKYSVIVHQLGLIRLVNLEHLKVDLSFRISSLHPDDEVLTTAVFNPNGINLAIGTSLGHVYIGSIREDSQGRPKVSFGKLDINGPKNTNAITSIQFSEFDPIGSFLVAFDNGTVKTWQTSVRNEQFLKLLELQQQNPGMAGNLPMFDLSESGYQQFDIVDKFDMFENPHGLEEVGDQERKQLKLLYLNKKHKLCDARFSPSKSSVDIYFSFVSALQYIYVRNYVQNAIVKRVSLMHFPTCVVMVDFNVMQNTYGEQDIDDDESQSDESTQLRKPNSNNQQLLGGEQVLALVGTKEGKVLTYKISSSGNHRLSETRSGISYGGISAVDISPNLGKMIAATESGEMFISDIIITSHKKQ